MFLIILIKSLIIGGWSASAWAPERHACFMPPPRRGWGRFEPSGELNSCEGDPASHFSFGLGFFFNTLGLFRCSRLLHPDVDHRIIPNWGAAALMLKNRNVGETLHDPKKWPSPAASSA